MPVKHALLALLAQRDLTGYELKVRFERALGDFWQLNSGQVYSTLERLRRGGLVARRKENGAVERSRYTLLPRGRRHLDRWMTAPAPRLRPIRDPLYVKLVFTTPEHAPLLLRSFAAELRRYGDAVQTLTALVARQPLSLTGRARWLVAEAARLQYDAQLRWLVTVRRVLSTDGAADRGDGAPVNVAATGRPLPRHDALRVASPPAPRIAATTTRASGRPA